VHLFFSVTHERNQIVLQILSLCSGGEIDLFNWRLEAPIVTYNLQHAKGAKDLPKASAKWICRTYRDEVLLTVHEDGSVWIHKCPVNGEEESANWKDSIASVGMCKGTIDFFVGDDSGHYFATGGKDNRIKVFELLFPEDSGSQEGSSLPLWRDLYQAKNLPNMNGIAAIPVLEWPTTAVFSSSPSSSSKGGDQVMTGTMDAEFRMYDFPVKRRPTTRVSLTTFEDCGLMSLVSLGKREDSHEILVFGSRKGDVLVVDAEVSRVVRRLRGVLGSARCLARIDASMVAVASLDRTLRVYNSRTGSLDHEFFLKTKPSSILFLPDISIETGEKSPREDDDWCIFGEEKEEDAQEYDKSGKGKRKQDNKSPEEDRQRKKRKQ
jgi:WD40 repeat protein